MTWSGVAAVTIAISGTLIDHRPTWVFGIPMIMHVLGVLTTLAFIFSGLLSMDQLGEALAEQFGVPFSEVVPQAVNPQVVRLLPERYKSF